MNLCNGMLLLARGRASPATDINDVEKSIKDIKAEHESRLMAMPGVVSVGLGQDEAGNPIIVIGVENEEYSHTLTLPQELHSYPVRFQVMGTIKAQ